MPISNRRPFGLIVMLCIVLSASRGEADGFKSGDIVAANVDGTWQLATIDGRIGKKLEITYGADEAETTVSEDKLRALAARDELDAGDRVVAVWRKGTRMYPGTIISKSGKSYQVKWDDGSAPSYVKLGKIAKLESVDNAGDFEVGDNVAAKYGSDYYLATIDALKGSSATVTYGDGTHGKVRTSDIRELARPRDLAPGDRVAAAWDTGAKMYPATIVERSTDGFTVKWDDGRTSVVAAKRIAKIRVAAQTNVTQTTTAVAASKPEGCVDWAFKEYERSWTSSAARTAAHEACDQIQDLTAAKLMYAYFAKSWTYAASVNAAAKLATSSLTGKHDMLKFAMEAYARSWTYSAAATAAAQKTAATPAGKLACLQREYAAYSESWTYSAAMDKAFELCAK